MWSHHDHEISHKEHKDHKDGRVMRPAWPFRGFRLRPEAERWRREGMNCQPLIIAACLMACTSALAAKGESKMPMLKWAGKEKVVNHHNDVPFRVLERKWGWGECCQCENVARTNANSQLGNGNIGIGNTSTFSHSHNENMIIHGDNLAALKALLPQYEGRVKCIYIDPPYNTGNEGWVYNDNVNDPQIKKWLGEVVGKEGEDFSRHDKWLCMMYPRLRLLQKLLADDGVIFISIDDNEFSRLRLICDEIFGQNCYKGTIVRATGQTTGQDSGGLGSSFDYILTYSKKPEFVFNGLPLTEKDLKRFKDKDDRGFYSYDQLRKTGTNDRREDRPNMYYAIKDPDGNDVYPMGPTGYEGCWRVERKTYERLVSEKMILWKKTTRLDKEVWWPYVKYYAEGRTKRPSPLWVDIEGNKKASRDLRAIFGTEKKFDFPKPVEMIERILKISTDKDSIVLDSFAGSGTTAHAVLKMNKEDGGNRKFILVELMDYAETVTAERVKRVISGYGEGDKAVEGTGGGFGYYELGEPLMIGENLNEALPLEKIREYVWYTETRGAGGSRSCATAAETAALHADTVNCVPPGNDPYLLGVADGTAYYFCYEKGKAVKLNRALLRKLKTKAERYVIYADICLLDDSELEKYNITFKKIPRDIARL